MFWTKRTILFAATGVAMAALHASTASAQCGNATIADMNWDSASFIAHLDRFILEHGFGCNAELVAGDTMPTGTSMIERGQPDIAPELWTNSFTEPLTRGVEEGRLKIAGWSLTEGGIEGFWVPQYLVDQYPEIATIEGVIAHAGQFRHPEDPNRSALYGCPAGWNCQITAENNFRALNLAEHGFDLIDPGSGAALAGSIARAYEREAPWVGYYWSPTSVLGKYAMVMVDFGSGIDEEHYLRCTSQEGCADPRPTMWPKSPTQTVTTAHFAERAPEAFAYLARRSFSNQEMNALLAWMDDQQADGEYAMEYFLRTYPATWSGWLDAETAARVRQAAGM